MRNEICNILEKAAMVAAIGLAGAGVVTAANEVNPASHTVTVRTSIGDLPPSIELGLESLALAATANIIKRRKLVGELFDQQA